VIPRPARGLADLAAKLASAIAPETSSRFAMANSAMIATLLTALAQDTERAVDSRMADIDDIKALFDAAGDDAPQAAARAAFRTRTPTSLRVADVDAVHGDGMGLLIDLHAWAEDHDAALDQQIWDFLSRHTERHRLDLG
jgi:hypothetical protein